MRTPDLKFSDAMIHVLLPHFCHWEGWFSLPTKVRDPTSSLLLKFIIPSMTLFFLHHFLSFPSGLLPLAFNHVVMFPILNSLGVPPSLSQLLGRTVYTCVCLPASHLLSFFFLIIIVDLQCLVNFRCRAKWPSHTSIYILFFTLSSIMFHHKWPNIVPCALQQNLIAYPFQIQ